MPIKSLVRFTYRNIEAPGGTSATGNSELMWLLLPTDWGTGRFGIGPVINFPADEKQFGADVWRFGLGSVVIQNSLEGKLLWGVLVQQVWGQTKANSDSVYASPIAVQPFATYSINENWYISNGEAPWSFNWQKKEWLIPMGVRVGRCSRPARAPGTPTWNTAGPLSGKTGRVQWPRIRCACRSPIHQNRKTNQYHEKLSHFSEFNWRIEQIINPPMC